MLTWTRQKKARNRSGNDSVIHKFYSGPANIITAVRLRRIRVRFCVTRSSTSSYVYSTGTQNTSVRRETTRCYDDSWHTFVDENRRTPFKSRNERCYYYFFFFNFFHAMTSCTRDRHATTVTGLKQYYDIIMVLRYLQVHDYLLEQSAKGIAIFADRVTFHRANRDTIRERATTYLQSRARARACTHNDDEPF